MLTGEGLLLVESERIPREMQDGLAEYNRLWRFLPALLSKKVCSTRHEERFERVENGDACVRLAVCWQWAAGGGGGTTGAVCAAII